MHIQSRFNTACSAIGHSCAQMRGIFRKAARCVKKRSSILWARIWSVLLFSLYAGLTIAKAEEQGAGNAPWESMLCNIADWFTGPTPMAVGTIAFGVAGASFVFGEELTGILRRTVNITMGICLSVGGATLLGWMAGQMDVAGCKV